MTSYGSPEVIHTDAWKTGSYNLTGFLSSLEYTQRYCNSNHNGTERCFCVHQTYIQLSYVHRRAPLLKALGGTSAHNFGTPQCGCGLGSSSEAPPACHELSPAQEDWSLKAPPLVPPPSLACALLLYDTGQYGVGLRCGASQNRFGVGKVSWNTIQREKELVAHRLPALLQEQRARTPALPPLTKARGPYCYGCSGLAVGASQRGCGTGDVSLSSTQREKNSVARRPCCQSTAPP